MSQLSNIIYKYILAKGRTDILEENNIQFTVKKTLLLNSLTEDLDTPIEEIHDSIKQFINTNKKQSISEIYSEIKEQQLSGYELLTKDQRNEIYPTIWQELGYEQNTNEFFIDNPDPDISLQTGYDRNIKDENYEIMINKFKTLLNETHHYLDKFINLP
ncbi:hypothetical protein C1645_815191 [Glomus cerebriforme]|uniref:Uncharacterized protein n=1 Tax=Glomus cerebriforme TaxID=658196 RepID=A0A397TFD4_9GLOM|nr:hypothetical protein C1645_815191 [Glomus cerebriforme]